jgi:hypothetical protein
MNETLYNQLLAEFRNAKSPETEQAFEQKFLERISEQTPEEAKAELTFLKEKFLSIKAEVKTYLSEKSTQVA